jgi:hypothetical protein
LDARETFRRNGAWFRHLYRGVPDDESDSCANSAHKRHIQRPAGQANKGTQASCCFRKYLFIGICLRNSTHNTTISAQLWWLQISRYQFFLFSLPDLRHPTSGRVQVSSSASPSHQQYIMKLQNADIARQTAGIGNSSLISPATMIGTEQAMVTR